MQPATNREVPCHGPLCSGCELGTKSVCVIVWSTLAARRQRSRFCPRQRLR